MKIWHISDTHTYHGFLNMPDDVDLVIFSGDCSNVRDPYVNEHEVRNFITWFDRLDIKHKVFVAGNHDTSIEKGLITKDNFEAEVLKSNDIEISNAEATLRADTLIEVDQEMAEKILKIMDFMDDLDDVQEVHTNAQFPDNFEPGE